MESSDQETKPACRSCSAPKSDLSQSGWQGRYDASQTGWDRGEANPMLVQWLQTGAMQPCRVLVPGCGRGHEVIRLAEAGFDVTAVDFAPSAVGHVQSELDRRGLSAKVVQSDLFAFDDDQAFDAIYEQTCLCAIDPSRWDAYQQMLAAWLRPSGKLFALFMQSDDPQGPPFSCDLPLMKSLFCESEWCWLADPIRVEHPMGLHELASIIARKEIE